MNICSNCVLEGFQEKGGMGGGGSPRGGEITAVRKWLHFNPFMDQISHTTVLREVNLRNFSVQCVCLIVQMLMYECEVLLQIGSQAMQV